MICLCIYKSLTLEVDQYREFDRRKSAPNKGRDTPAVVNSIDTIWMRTGGARCNSHMF